MGNKYGLDPIDANDANSDLDNDGLSNLQEYQLGTLPNCADTMAMICPMVGNIVMV